MTDTEVGQRDFSSPQAELVLARSDPTGSVSSLTRVISDI